MRDSWPTALAIVLLAVASIITRGLGQVTERIGAESHTHATYPLRTSPLIGRWEEPESGLGCRVKITPSVLYLVSGDEDEDSIYEFEALSRCGSAGRGSLWGVVHLNRVGGVNTCEVGRPTGIDYFLSSEVLQIHWQNPRERPSWIRANPLVLVRHDARETRSVDSEEQP